MDSRAYWQSREAEQRKYDIRDERAYQKQINEIYQSTLDQVQKEIDSFYAKYAKKEDITMAEAKKRADKLDMEAYARKAKKYVMEKDFSEQANAEMRLYNLTMKVNRLELLKANVGLEMVSGFDALQKYFDEVLTNRALSESKRQAGILGKSVFNNAKAAHAVVNASFQNATFSDRIWMHQDLLKNELNKLLQTGLVQGRGSRELARSLRKQFSVSVSNAERLMVTELTRVRTEAQRQSFERNGYENYEFIAEPTACPICRALDGKVFEVSKMLPAENAAPMHPHCRCSVAAYMDRETFDKWLNGYSEKSDDQFDSENVLNVFHLNFPEKGGRLRNKELMQKARTELDRYFQVTGLHSDGENFYMRDSEDNIVKKFTPDQLAAIIKKTKSYKGQEVKVYSCNAGAEGMVAAQDLANALGVPVKAPSEDIVLMSDGKFRIISKRDKDGKYLDAYPVDDGWVVMKPRR